MTHHFKTAEIHKLVSAGIPVLLTGEKGSGKTTMAMNVAKALDLDFYGMSMTRQTTLSHLLGFISVNGSYIPSQLRHAVENGGLFLLDEIDAADPNVILSLNTLENGFISFPTGVLHVHEDFRLIATANPQNEHQHYVGRSKLDAATLDRFDIVEVPRDPNLEKSLVDSDTIRRIEIVRKLLSDYNCSTSVSMRDSLRYHKRKQLGLTEGFFERLIGDNPSVQEDYKKAIASMPKYMNQSECKTLDDLIGLLEVQ